MSSNSYHFYSQLRNERVYLFDTSRVLSCWYYPEYVEVVYQDGRRERVLTPFSDHMDIEEGEEEKENEEEVQEAEPIPELIPELIPEQNNEIIPPVQEQEPQEEEDNITEPETDHEDTDSEEWIEAPEPVGGI